MAKPLSADEIEILRECFNEYDTDRGGNITVEEFGRVMKKSDPKVTDEEVAKIVKEVDIDGDGTINFDEFITMMTGRSREPPAEAKKPAEPTPSVVITPAPVIAQMGAAVHAVSKISAKMQKTKRANQWYKDAWTDYAGTEESITQSQLRQLVTSIGLEPITDAEIEELIDSVDGEGKITYDQFLQFAKRQEVDDIYSGYGI